jgi:predicted Rdx family selenoprotein
MTTYKDALEYCNKAEWANNKDWSNKELISKTKTRIEEVKHYCKLYE